MICAQQLLWWLLWHSPWGLSGQHVRQTYMFQTFRGAPIAYRLPHRIGYSVIDGVADPITWASKSIFVFGKRWSRK
jgi:hypothetical protein